MFTHPFSLFRHLLLFSVCILLAISCKKSTPNDPNPDLAAKVSGRYTIQTFTVAGSSGSQPTTIASSTVDVIRNGTALDVVDITVNYTFAGSSGSQSYTESKTIPLKASDNNRIDLYSGSTVVGTWTTIQLTLIGYPFNGTLVNITAVKQ